MIVNGLVITDLDGTLLNSAHQLTSTNKQSLEALKSHNYLRAIATGRSLKVARKVLNNDFPIDYLIFSSGAGILKWSTQELIHENHMKESSIQSITDFLIQKRYDFMLHHQIPDNHFFDYFESGQINTDFQTRLNHYRNYAKPLEMPHIPLASQFIIVLPAHTDTHQQYQYLKATFSEHSVIYATSPLDGQSAWIEVFPRQVSKSQASQWLMTQYELNVSQVMAIGNDYNDRDLLDWAGSSFIVENAPDDLKAQHQQVASNNENGFSQAILQWMS